MKQFGVMMLGGIVVVSLAGLLWAQGIIPTDMGSAREIVAARKALMVSIKLNMDDVNTKTGAGEIGAIQANASALDVMARIMPALYREKHESAYDGKGKYYKGAPAADFEKICEQLRAAAQGLFESAAAEDKAGIKTGIGRVYQTCGICHKAYRGEF